MQHGASQPEVIGEIDIQPPKRVGLRVGPLFSSPDECNAAAGRLDAEAIRHLPWLGPAFGGPDKTRSSMVMGR